MESEPEHDELLALREHLDTDEMQRLRELEIACHACANYFNTGILATQGLADHGDMSMAYGIAVSALERAGFTLQA